MTDWTTTPPADGTLCVVETPRGNYFFGRWIGEQERAGLRDTRTGKLILWPVGIRLYLPIPEPGEGCATCGGTEYVDVKTKSLKGFRERCPDCTPSAAADTGQRGGEDHQGRACGGCWEWIRMTPEVTDGAKRLAKLTQRGMICGPGKRTVHENTCACEEFTLPPRTPPSQPSETDTGSTCGECTATDENDGEVPEGCRMDDGEEVCDTDPACEHYRPRTDDAEPTTYDEFKAKHPLLLLREEFDLHVSETRADLDALRKDVEEHCATATDLEELAERVERLAWNLNKLRDDDACGGCGLLERLDALERGASHVPHQVKRITALERAHDKLIVRIERLERTTDDLGSAQERTAGMVREVLGVVTLHARFYSSGNPDKMCDVLAKIRTIAESKEG